MPRNREDVDTVWVMDALDWDDPRKKPEDVVLERLLFHVDTNPSNPVTGVYNGKTLLMCKPSRGTGCWTAAVEHTSMGHGVRSWQPEAVPDETFQTLKDATEYAKALSMFHDLTEQAKETVQDSRFSKVAALEEKMYLDPEVPEELRPPPDRRMSVRYMSKKRPPVW